MVLTLSLVRHGQTVYNAEGRLQGWCDSPLTPGGLAGARATAAHLAGRPFEAAYVSSSGRAQATANVILTQHPTALVIADPDLREFRFGELEARPESELRARYDPEEMVAGILDGTFAGLPGGEPAARYLARVRAAFARIERRHPTGEVLVVSHGLTLLAFLSMIDSRPILPLPNSSVSTVQVHPGGEREVIAVAVDPAGQGVPDMIGATRSPEPAL